MPHFVQFILSLLALLKPSDILPFLLLLLFNFPLTFSLGAFVFLSTHLLQQKTNNDWAKPNQKWPWGERGKGKLGRIGEPRASSRKEARRGLGGEEWVDGRFGADGKGGKDIGKGGARYHGMSFR